MFLLPLRKIIAQILLHVEVPYTWTLVYTGCLQPDGNHIIARLMEIRDYLQQATAMLESLGNQHDQVNYFQSYPWGSSWF